MADPTGKKKTGKVLRPEGQLRQSQLTMTFGPGSMVDLVDRAVVIGGLEHWGYGKRGFVALDDARLRRSLIPRLKAIDPELDLAKENYFRMPPEGEQRDASPAVGVRALEFPRWFVCRGCRRLLRAAEGLENSGPRYKHQCGKNKSASAVPVRFVASCKKGHLSDFPWTPFAHMNREEGICDRVELYLEEKSLGDVAQIFARCAGCDSSTPMSLASGLPFKCGGDRPWLGGRAADEPCDERAKLLVRTASDAYFAQVESALRLPDPGPGPLRLRLRDKDVWKAVQKVTKVEQLAMIAELQDHVAGAIAGFSLAEVLSAIELERGMGAGAKERPLRSAEYERLTHAELELPGVTHEADAQFAAYRVPKDKLALPPEVAGLVVVPALREVRVQVSFSRFTSIGANLQGETDFDAGKVRPSVLTLPSGGQKWLPAAEIRGEGVFIELDPGRLRDWENRLAVLDRAARLERAFAADGGAGQFPGVRFYLLHSLSHLLLTAISLECGYAASSIRERIYCGKAEEDGPDMAAVMLMTGTTGSEGTLGGLVEEGRRIRHHLREAWELGRLCSSDPVCAAHDPSAPSSDRRTEGAACHGCLYIAEVSCEWFNRKLDRALVVPTIGNDPELAFFRERP